MENIGRYAWAGLWTFVADDIRHSLSVVPKTSRSSNRNGHRGVIPRRSCTFSRHTGVHSIPRYDLKLTSKQAMLTRLGFHKTLLIYSFVQGTVMLVGFSLIKTRFPKSQIEARHEKIKWVDKVYFKDPVFWSFWVGLLFTV